MLRLSMTPTSLQEPRSFRPNYNLICRKLQKKFSSILKNVENRMIRSDSCLTIFQGSMHGGDFSRAEFFPGFLRGFGGSLYTCTSLT